MSMISACWLGGPVGVSGVSGMSGPSGVPGVSGEGGVSGVPGVGEGVDGLSGVAGDPGTVGTVGVGALSFVSSSSPPQAVSATDSVAIAIARSHVGTAPPKYARVWARGTNRSNFIFDCLVRRSSRI
ncbi:hypothetical protein EYW45_02330 [Achromobacter sp. KS-M25]|nr:hypothetical protein [Achromobacter aestuarii]